MKSGVGSCSLSSKKSDQVRVSLRLVNYFPNFRSGLLRCSNAAIPSKRCRRGWGGGGGRRVAGELGEMRNMHERNNTICYIVLRTRCAIVYEIVTSNRNSVT